MANNRMFLIHKPTRLGVSLGKRIGWGWYNAPEKSELERFYDYLSKHPDGSQDDFILAMEDCRNSSCFDEWKYTYEKVDGFLLFDIKTDNHRIQADAQRCSFEDTPEKEEGNE